MSARPGSFKPYDNWRYGNRLFNSVTVTDCSTAWTHRGDQWHAHRCDTLLHTPLRASGFSGSSLWREAALVAWQSALTDMQSNTGFGCPLCMPVQTDLARMRKFASSCRHLNALSLCKRRPRPGLRQLLYTSAAKSAAPPAPVDIDNTIVQLYPQGKRWEDIDRWVMFSDLHVSVKTLATCIAVLKKVKQEATKRKAGILFLGKFPNTHVIFAF